MKNNESIVCLGHDENALLFNSSGIRGIVVKDRSKLLDEINLLIKNDIKIILISDNFKKEVEEVRNELNSVYPIFLLLPLDGISKDGVEQIRKDVERATGINLF
jgi:vacuolar-type H+-ATPase subunit F/Vma7